MSVRAYIFEEKQVKSDKNDCYKYEIYQEKDPMFNVWRQTHLLDLFFAFGFDGTNNDCVGELELTDEGLEEFLKDKEKNTKHWTDYDLEILDKIIDYFKDNNWILRLRTY